MEITMDLDAMRADFDQHDKEVEEFWKNIDKHRAEGKIGVKVDGSRWFVMTGRELTYDEIYGPYLNEKKSGLKLEM